MGIPGLEPRFLDSAFALTFTVPQGPGAGVGTAPVPQLP